MPDGLDGLLDIKAPRKPPLLKDALRHSLLEIADS
jgi:hypothetical protein